MKLCAFDDMCGSEVMLDVPACFMQLLMPAVMFWF